MKTMIGLILLAALCVALGIVLVSTRRQAADEKQKDTEKIAMLSNQWEQTEGKLQEQKQVNLSLEKDVETRKQQYSELNGRLTDLTNRYTGIAGTLVKTEDSLKATKEEVARRDAKIAQHNLVRVSSIFPPNCEMLDRDEGSKLLRPGQVVFCVLSEAASNEPSRRVGAAIGVVVGGLIGLVLLLIAVLPAIRRGRDEAFQE